MQNIAAVTMAGTSHASLGVWQDVRSYAKLRIEQVFASAEERALETRFMILSSTDTPVSMNDGSLLSVDNTIEAGEQYSFIWLPAFLAGGEAQMRELLTREAGLLRWLAKQHENGAIIGASGPAVLVLAAAGLVDQVPLPLPPALRGMGHVLFPKRMLADTMGLADRGDIILSAGVAHDHSAVLRGIGRVMGPHMNLWLHAVLALPVESSLETEDPLMLRARLWLDQTFASRVRIADLAKHLSISRSALNRKFCKVFGLTPKAYVQSVRLEAARQMLAKTDRKIDEVAAKIGYSDTRLFRTMFTNETGLSPREWRRRNWEKESMDGDTAIP